MTKAQLSILKRILNLLAVNDYCMIAILLLIYIKYIPVPMGLHKECFSKEEHISPHFMFISSTVYNRFKGLKHVGQVTIRSLFVRGPAIRLFFKGPGPAL